MVRVLRCASGRVLRGSILIGVALFLSLLAVYRTDGFDPAQISTSLIEELDPLSSVLLEWPAEWRYLGKGRQQFAFESLDGRYVLKFIRQKSLLRKLYETTGLPTSRQRERWRKKDELYVEGYPLAFEKLKEETGLLVLHRGRARERFPTVEVRDAASGSFQIDLNQVPFVLQKKGGLSFLEALGLHKGEPSFQHLLEAFLSFHEKRLFLHIGDGDRDLKKNYQWEEGRLLYIDPGRFFFHPVWDARAFEKERFNAVYQLRKWLLQEAPEWLEWFDTRWQERGVLS